MATSLTVAYARELPYLLEVKKDTPLFAAPTMKSERLGVAEAGMTFLFVEKSKKGIWLRLKDADGTYGWMPADRTDYKEVSDARQSIEQIQQISSAAYKENLTKQKTKEEMMEEALKARAEAQEEAFRSPFLRLAPLMKWLSESEPASNRIGLRIDYNLGHSSLANKGVLDPAWASLEATFPSPQISHSSDFSAAARYVWRAPLWGPFLYGPDLGYSIDNVDSDYRHHLSVGLSGGIALGPVDLMLRGSYDFFAQSRMGVEAQLGVSF